MSDGTSTDSSDDWFDALRASAISDDIELELERVAAEEEVELTDDRGRQLREQLNEAMASPASDGDHYRAKYIGAGLAVEIQRPALLKAVARVALFFVFPLVPTIVFASLSSVADVVGALRRVAAEEVIVYAALLRLSRRQQPLPPLSALLLASNEIWQEPGLTALDRTAIGRERILQRLQRSGVISVDGDQLALGRLVAR